MSVAFDTDHLYKTYFRLSLPVVLGMVVSLIYNLADTFFISQTNNTNIIAGVSLCTPLFSTLMAFGNIFGQGGSSLISRLLGQNNRIGTARVSSFCFYISVIVGIFLAFVLSLLRNPILVLFGAESETMPYASDYYTVLAIGAPFVVLNFVYCNLVRCEGLSTESMTGTILGAVINIILDPILISVFDMGACGAAVATVIGFIFSVIYFLRILKKKSQALSISPKDCQVSKSEIVQIFGVGISAALNNLMQSLTVVVVNQYLLPYGNDKIAAMGIVSKVSMIIQLILAGFTFGGVPIFGYLYGKENRYNLIKLTRFCLVFLSVISIGMTVVLTMFASPLMYVFVKDVSLVEIGAYMLRWQVASSLFVAVTLLYTVIFQATGKVVPAFILSISRQGVVFLLSIIVSVRLFAYKGIIISQSVANILSAILALVLYLFFNRFTFHQNGKRVIAENEESNVADYHFS